MGISRELKKRSGEKCELCSSSESLNSYDVAPKSGERLEDQIAICEVCRLQIEGKEETDNNHWRCLNESMWSEVPAVQVVVFRQLWKLKETDWANDLRDMMYMEDGTREWAESTLEDESDMVVHKDSNGVVLEAGDTVVLIKDLKVKGSSLVAKRGTAVRRIRLVQDNPNHIEGKVEGQTVVILTQFVKK
ncbi:MAG: PhnA domain-containing protein [Saprospiraceae bacterium]|nr:PhnA domain-containing protein [Saprospiraceae bacterium]